MISRIYPKQRRHKSAENPRQTKNAKEKRRHHSKPMQRAKDALTSQMTPKRSNMYARFVKEQ